MWFKEKILTTFKFCPSQCEYQILEFLAIWQWLISLGVSSRAITIGKNVEMRWWQKCFHFILTKHIFFVKSALNIYHPWKLMAEVSFRIFNGRDFVLVDRWFNMHNFSGKAQDCEELQILLTFHGLTVYLSTTLFNLHILHNCQMNNPLHTR